MPNENGSATDEGSLAETAILNISQSLFGAAVKPAITKDLLGFLGLGGSADVTAYLTKIQQQLTQMQAQLTQLQAGVDQIETGIVVIEEQFDDVNLQAKLDAVAAASASITSNFKTYVNAVHGLTSSNPALVTEGAKEIFELMGVINLSQIATQMTVLQGLFVPNNNQGKGLIDLQHHYVRQGILDFASNKENYRYKGTPSCNIPSSDGIFESGHILSVGHTIADDLLRKGVVGAFKMFLTVQTQGLILLSVGWSGTLQEPQLADQVHGIKVVTDAMTAFEPAVKQTVDDEINTCVQQFGQILKGDAVSGVYMFDSSPGHEGTGGCPCVGWFMWETVPLQGDGSQVGLKMVAWGKPDVRAIIIQHEGGFYGRYPWQHFEGGGAFQAVPYADIPTELQFIRSLQLGS